MYLDKVIKALNEFDEVTEAAKQLFNETKKQLQLDYGNTGRLFVEKHEVAKQLYNATIDEARNKAKEIVKAEFETLREILKAFVATPVPSDFIATLEAIKATGKNLSAEEVAMYLDKYKNNYTAYRSLANVLYELTGRKNLVVTYDAVLNDIQEHEQYLERIFNNNANEYVRALFTSEQHSPLVKLDASLTEFIQNDVSKYGDAEE